VQQSAKWLKPFRGKTNAYFATLSVSLSFPFKPDLNIIETGADICESYPLSKPSLENEILTLKNDTFLKTRAGQEFFWKLVPRHKFPNLRRCSEIVHSCFGSTSLCESAFSYLKMAKSKQRSNTTELPETGPHPILT
jgi:hypothetical protein